MILLKKQNKIEVWDKAEIDFFLFRKITVVKVGVIKSDNKGIFQYFPREDFMSFTRLGLDNLTDILKEVQDDGFEDFDETKW